jgi:isopenicillin N synthase-like dioxygenase
VDLELIDPFGDANSQADLMDRVCSTVGFFRIPFSAVDAAIRERAWSAASDFFALPIEHKMAVTFPEPGYPYGYSPFQFETLAASQGESTPPDLKESYSVGPDCIGPNPAELAPGEDWIRSPSLWAAHPPGLKDAWSTYFQAMSLVSAQLLTIMAVALGLEHDHFGPLIQHHTSAMRALHYPGLGAQAPGDGLRAGAHSTSLRAGAHSDYGTLTILRTDGVPGLEVQNVDGSWSAVAHEPETFVVNLGDSIAQWTNDRWRSTVHRVTAIDPAPRESMAFFHMANWDALIECLPTCTTPDNPPRYEPVLAGPWLMSKFQSTVS